MSDLGDRDAGLACSLDAKDQQDRLDSWRDVVKNVEHRQRIENGWRLGFRFDEELAGWIATLAVQEHECCPFFAFSLTIGPGPRSATRSLTLDLVAPPDAQLLLDELIGEAAA